MAIELSQKTQLVLEQRNLTPNIILEIDGVDKIYGALNVEKIPHFDEDNLFFDLTPDLYWDGVIVDTNSRDYISLSGSGNTLSQQLLQDKGSAQSVTTFQVELIDKNEEITQLVTPGVILDEIIGVKARLYLNFKGKGTTHPEDSILFHRGIISKVQTGPASVSLTISSPERQKRQKVFINQKAVLSAGINSVVTTIPVVSTEGFFLPSDSGVMRSFVQINDEVIEYTSFDSTNFYGCTRGSLGTVAATHNIDDEASSIYRLEENCINMALKLMLSGGDSVYTTNNIKQFNFYTPTDSRRGIIFFNYYDIREKTGIVIGDKVDVSSSTNSNDASNLIITGYGKNDYGSWIEVDYTFNDEFDSSAVCSFKSKYNVLSDGLGMTPDDVDVYRHEQLRTRFASNLAQYVFYLKDTINGEEFLPQQVYYPSGFYSIPRKTKSSINVTVPPIADDKVTFLDETNVVKPSGIKPERSIDANFYNAVLFKYQKDPIDDKYLRGKLNFSSDSITRIKNVGNKPLAIESDGLQDTPDTETLIRINSRRLLERYQFASEKIPGVQIFSKDGYVVEVGDAVVFGSPDLQVSDITKGDRSFTPKLYECVNKSMNFKTGEIKVDLLSTNFALDGRYGVISPSSYVGTGSTTSRIVIVDSFSTLTDGLPNKEKDKWQDYIGETILVHNFDRSISETTTFLGFDPSDDYAMLVDPPLSFTPSAGLLVDMPDYPSSSDPNIQAKWKLLHCAFDPQVLVTSGTSNTIFDVGAGDIGKFFVGSIVRVHNFSYSVDSPERTVIDITGTTITVNDSLGFTPVAGYEIDLIGFSSDKWLCYRWI